MIGVSSLVHDKFDVVSLNGKSTILNYFKNDRRPKSREIEPAHTAAILFLSPFSVPSAWQQPKSWITLLVVELAAVDLEGLEHVLQDHGMKLAGLDGQQRSLSSEGG